MQSSIKIESLLMWLYIIISSKNIFFDSLVVCLRWVRSRLIQSPRIAWGGEELLNFITLTSSSSTIHLSSFRNQTNLSTAKSEKTYNKNLAYGRQSISRPMRIVAPRVDQEYQKTQCFGKMDKITKNTKTQKRLEIWQN